MPQLLFAVAVLMPTALMLVGAWMALQSRSSNARRWRTFIALSGLALACTLVTLWVQPSLPVLRPWLASNSFGTACAVLVQALGTVIASFSSRYLDGEPGQPRYIASLGSLLAAVHVLLLADHWLVLILSWSLIGTALRPLLCFYSDRPFAVLAAQKKSASDWIADLLLAAAAGLAWKAAGSGSFPALWACLGRGGVPLSLQACAACLAMAVIFRTALLPAHGWLIQVMEAPTPVSALLHAGVVNLGGYVLIRFAPLLEHATAARVLLLAFGGGTAVLAGQVMLTRVSVKVRLAWSTVAQMGFMVLECSLGLYSLAALHLIGHSLYKADVFLSASTVVRQTRLQALRGAVPPVPFSLYLAPCVSAGLVMALQQLTGIGWPWWWSIVLGLAWAPLLWLPAPAGVSRAMVRHLVIGTLMIASLTGLGLLAHASRLGPRDAPDDALGPIALAGMTVLYLSLVVMHSRPQVLQGWRRWSYAGFYLDEIATRLVVRGWAPVKVVMIQSDGRKTV